MPYPPNRIIVLSPGPIRADGRFDNFSGGTYVGGQVRLEAAARIAENNPHCELILVGGYNKVTPQSHPTIEGRLPTSDKVAGMARFIIASTASEPNLKLVPSLPCTYHNIIAAFRALVINRDQVDQLGILTNACHLVRAQAFAERAALQLGLSSNVQFIPIPAEDVLDLSIESIIGDDRRAEYVARIKLEENGVADINAGRYMDSCLGQNRESLLPVLAEYAAVLLTPDEYEAYSSQLANAAENAIVSS